MLIASITELNFYSKFPFLLVAENPQSVQDAPSPVLPERFGMGLWSMEYEVGSTSGGSPIRKVLQLHVGEPIDGVSEALLLSSPGHPYESAIDCDSSAGGWLQRRTLNEVMCYEWCLARKFGFIFQDPTQASPLLRSLVWTPPHAPLFLLQV